MGLSIHQNHKYRPRFFALVCTVLLISLLLPVVVSATPIKETATLGEVSRPYTISGRKVSLDILVENNQEVEKVEYYYQHRMLQKETMPPFLFDSQRLIDGDREVVQKSYYKDKTIRQLTAYVSVNNGGSNPQLFRYFYLQQEVLIRTIVIIICALSVVLFILWLLRLIYRRQVSAQNHGIKVTGRRAWLKHIIMPKYHLKFEGARRLQIMSALLLLRLAFAGVLLALIFRAYILVPYAVDGVSMSPTLRSGDRILVLKFGKDWAGLTKQTVLPAREQVIVFDAFISGQSKRLVKRVIGLPGDMVSLKDGVYTIFNIENPQGFRIETNNPRGLPYTDGYVDRMIVPEGEVFVSGDNRAFGGSYDSRFGLGTIPLDQITGPARIQLLSTHGLVTLIK